MYYLEVKVSEYIHVFEVFYPFKHYDKGSWYKTVVEMVSPNEQLKKKIDSNKKSVKKIRRLICISI